MIFFAHFEVITTIIFALSKCLGEKHFRIAYISSMSATEKTKRQIGCTHHGTYNSSVYEVNAPLRTLPFLRRGHKTGFLWCRVSLADREGRVPSGGGTQAGSRRLLIRLLEL